MTHCPETGTKNRYQKTCTSFLQVCHAIRYRFFLVPKSGTVRALLYSVKETGFLVPVFGTGYCVMGLSGYFTISNGIFKFNLPDLIVSEISGDSKFTRGTPAPFGRYLSENVCTRSNYLTTSNCVFLILTFY